MNLVSRYTVFALSYEARRDIGDFLEELRGRGDLISIFIYDDISPETARQSSGLRIQDVHVDAWVLRPLWDAMNYRGPTPPEEFLNLPVEVLLLWTEDELLRIRTFGQRRLELLKEGLSKHSLNLRKARSRST